MHGTMNIKLIQHEENSNFCCLGFLEWMLLE